MRYICLLLCLVVAPAYAEWKVTGSTDEMTGKKSFSIISPLVDPTKKMAFPYSATKAFLGAGCSKTREWAYVGFTTTPNLSTSDYADGKKRVVTRIKWDEQLGDITLLHGPGTKFASIYNSKQALDNINQSGTALLELNWYGEGRVHFKFPLAGSSAALKEMRDGCAGK
ncbi:MAG: hypothetical protein KAJ19_05000 [Gammaproteobacteria bacterium]|nr:hypothetical protein [Gammaproteobacteria bacterium]